MNNTYGFLSRGEWAARERTPSDYDWDNLRTSTDLSLYANVAEIAAATEALHSLYQDEGRAMRAAKQAAASAFARHPGEERKAWVMMFGNLQGYLRRVHSRWSVSCAASQDVFTNGKEIGAALHNRDGGVSKCVSE